MTTAALPRVLVVDDEPQLVLVVGFALETYGFDSVGVDSAEAAIRAIAAGGIDLVVSDVMLPGMSGIELCRAIRAAGGPPVLLLSARGEVEERLAGLEAGADDYIAKPFHPREVALRAAGILRRSPREPGPVIDVDGLHLDATRLAVTLDGARVQLTAIEFRFLFHLAAHRGEVIAASTLLREVWMTEWTVGGADIVKATVHRIRGKLGESADAPRHLVTVRGVGYLVPA